MVAPCVLGATGRTNWWNLHSKAQAEQGSHRGRVVAPAVAFRTRATCKQPTHVSPRLFSYEQPTRFIVANQTAVMAFVHTT